ncbi:MAG TPA: Na+/H+ antiporter [Solirubrobacteraceae bacterium]|nr:Na+/H+ antiporter [Solirubrobacteraceae bacterium]
MLVAVSLLAEVARRLGVPYPILLVVAGLVLGFVPGLSAPVLDPKTFFFFFLPPLVYSEAYLFSTDELKAHVPEIAVLAVGLVLATAGAVAVLAHGLVGLSWPAAFVLGAVLGPTDPIAATAVIRGLGVSGRLVTVLEGESLVNDATALVLYKLAIGWAGAGALSLGHAAAEFVWVSFGGIGTGALVAWAALAARRWIREPEPEIALSLVMPFAAYFPAERLGVSGVLAAVTAGLLMGRDAHAVAPGTRLRRHAFWEVLVFLLNSTLFLLVGLTFPDVLHRLGGTPPRELVAYAIAIMAAVVALRMAWMLLLARLGSVLEPRSAGRLRMQELVVLGWSGMRGGVSLGAALAVPFTVAGHPFPGRDEIIFVTYTVLLGTLVMPGLTLGGLIRRLGVGSGEAASRSDARAHLLRAAVEHLDELARNDELPEDVADMLRALYSSRLEGLRSVPGHSDGVAPADVVREARHGAIAVQREALAQLAGEGEISDETARLLERELDLEEAMSAR